MPYSLIWLPEVLLRAKLKVAPVDGWESRGAGDVGSIQGVVCHHTAGRRTGNMPALRTLIDGRENLRGPLSQLGLGRDGTFYVIAAGRAHHAGRGKWNSVTRGNHHFIGIEAENTGRPDDPWPAIQMECYRRGVAAIIAHLKLDEGACVGHKEYARPAGRKPDPSFDMSEFRAGVATILAGTATLPDLIPPLESPRSGRRGRPTLRRGASGDLVLALQRRIGAPTSALFGPQTEAAVRSFQHRHDLVPDGIVGPKTWAALDRSAALANPSTTPVRDSEALELATGA